MSECVPLLACEGGSREMHVNLRHEHRSQIKACLTCPWCVAGQTMADVCTPWSCLLLLLSWGRSAHDLADGGGGAVVVHGSQVGQATQRLLRVLKQVRVVCHNVSRSVGCVCALKSVQRCTQMNVAKPQNSSTAEAMHTHIHSDKYVQAPPKRSLTAENVLNPKLCWYWSKIDTCMSAQRAGCFLRRAVFHCTCECVVRET